MPKPRNSYAQAELKGTAAQNAGRYKDRKNAPTTTGDVGKPPSYFSKEQKAVWKVVVESIPGGVAGTADRIAVEMAARLLYQFRTDPTMQASKQALLANLLSRLGMDPQARTRLQIGDPVAKKETSARDQYKAAVKTHGSTTIQ